MANKTVYPYGTGGTLPSSVGIVNDFKTGGADKALSAEAGKNLYGQVSNIQEQTIGIVEKDYVWSNGYLAPAVTASNNSQFCQPVLFKAGETLMYKTGYTYRYGAVQVADDTPISVGDSSPVVQQLIDASEANKQYSYTFSQDMWVVITVQKAFNEVYAVSEDSLKKQVGELMEYLHPKTRKFKAMVGLLSATTGSYPTSMQYYLGDSHTPRFIRLPRFGGMTVESTGIYGGSVFYYDKNQVYLGSDVRTTLNTTGGPQTISTFPNNAYYFRLGMGGQWNEVVITGAFGDDCEVFAIRPSNGYQRFIFEVFTDFCNGENTGSSELQKQFENTTDAAMLHLPASYKEKGNGTPLIILLHGAANDYSVSSTGFPASCPLAPEWDAAGFAQMDVDLIPDEYNSLNTNTGGGSSDDAECVFAAYRWAIEHFNIRRDGVYLMGRSRGGQAVLQILGKYNPNVMPIIAAVDNAGANSIINYGIMNGASANQWNLICASYNLPTEGRPTTDGTHPFLAQDSIYNFLNDNIGRWFNKAKVAFLLTVENGNEEKTPSEILQFLHEHPRSGGVDDADYLAFLAKLRFRSPVPLRFDWCAADTVQPWRANNGVGNYSKIVKDGFVNNLSGNSEYREWPTVDQTTPSVSGATDRGHWHELFNYVSGDYTLPNGTVLTNPSMARLEWLLWCHSHDNRDLL